MHRAFLVCYRLRFKDKHATQSCVMISITYNVIAFDNNEGHGDELFMVLSLMFCLGIQEDLCFCKIISFFFQFKRFLVNSPLIVSCFIQFSSVFAICIIVTVVNDILIHCIGGDFYERNET